MKQTEEILRQIIEDRKGHEAMKTKFPHLDEFLDGGFFKKELIVIGAHTGVGKSQIAGQLFYNIATQGFKCAYFSLEISNQMIVSRLVGANANIKPTRIRYGMLTPTEHQNKLEAQADLVSLGDLVNYADDVYTLDEIKKQISASNYDFVVIDFMQNIMDRLSDEYARMSKISLELQKLAKEKDCCILILSQLSNAVAKEKNGGKVIEYKGSGGIGAACDLGFILSRDLDADPNMAIDAKFHWVNLLVKKNRRGISGATFDLKFRNPGGAIYE